MSLPFISPASLCHALSYNGAAMEMTRYKTFFISLYRPLPCRVDEMEDRSRGEENEQIMNNILYKLMVVCQA